MLRLLRAPSLLLALAAPLLAACNTPTELALFAGPLEVSFSTAQLALPAGLREGTGAGSTLRSIPCGTAPLPACPTIDGADQVVLECVAGVCDPAPKTIVTPLGDVVDLDTSSGDLEGLLSTIDRIEVTRIDATIRTNTLTVATAPVDVYWGPEGATGIDETRHLALIPAVAAGSTTLGPVVLDPAGVDGLSDHLVGVSRRVRFFGRTRIDLVPGGPFPEGALDMEVLVAVRALGTIGG
jgi:hypothetical protein